MPATVFAEDIENSHIIIVNGVAKIYGMTGFRVGWVVAPRDLVRVMTNVTAQTTSACPGQPGGGGGRVERPAIRGRGDPAADPE